MGSSVIVPSSPVAEGDRVKEVTRGAVVEEDTGGAVRNRICSNYGTRAVPKTMRVAVVVVFDQPA